MTWESRAAIREVPPGNMADCVHCGKNIGFMAGRKLKRVIANVYEDGVWLRVEQYHLVSRQGDECYSDAGSPYGDPEPEPRRGR